jgi:hypothetical protein
MAAGAMYRPLLDMVPVAGEMDHVTAVLLVPETVALNCCVAPAYRLADVGLSLMDTTGRGAAFTFRVRLVGCASDPEVPATFSAKAPVAVLELVTMLSVAVADPLPAGVSDAGLSEQVAFAGQPETDKFTAVLNPLVDVTVTVELPVWP